jgi:hypothetical protein
MHAYASALSACGVRESVVPKKVGHDHKRVSRRAVGELLGSDTSRWCDKAGEKALGPDGPKYTAFYLPRGYTWDLPCATYLHMAQDA